jgi:hypothetical protein
VPGIVISPYAKAGYIDHQQLSHDAYLKFIESDFLGGKRLDPATDGRPDPRPDVRENAPGLGAIVSDFNFGQQPRPPLILPTHPAPGPASSLPGASPTPAPVKPATPSLSLQLTASVAPNQSLRRNHGRVYLTVGCNMACSLDAHGHLSLTRRHRHLGLRRVRTTLTGGRAERIGLKLSQRNLAAVKRALRKGRKVKASIAIVAVGIDGLHRSRSVTVGLTYR